MTEPLSINPNVAGIVPPPIDSFNRRIAALRHTGADVISLAQGVADFMPPTNALQVLRDELETPWLHSYSHDAGLLRARQAVAKWLVNGGLVRSPDDEILLTAGASQAFFSALLTLVRPGDRVVLPTPYYFDHHYAVLACGAIPVEVSMCADGDKWRFDVPALVAAAKHARALVLVSPNNPTGAVLTAAELEELAHGLSDTETAVITDETYRGFSYTDEINTVVGAHAGLVERTVVIGSFSKLFGLAGWRIGYCAAPRPVIAQALKLQDTLVICAPVASQLLVAVALEDDESSFIADCRAELSQRRAVLRRGIGAIEQLRWREPQGSFFAFVELLDNEDDEACARALLEHVHVAVMPGSAFGGFGKGYVRLSFGNVPSARLEEACRRVAAFFQR